MTQTAEDLTINYEEGGEEIVKELDKVILSKGSWTTIMFRYQEFNKAKQDFGPIKYSIRRYQKRNNQYWQKSKFNISSSEQASKIIDVLGKWLKQEKL